MNKQRLQLIAQAAKVVQSESKTALKGLKDKCCQSLIGNMLANKKTLTM